ncbi:MAG: tetratricopeptide repeat protein [candidate division Zixibacteria bacterium]|nr:tetratricopeptide repeat protein [candidate division Zixibacteria bacterium]
MKTNAIALGVIAVATLAYFAFSSPTPKPMPGQQQMGQQGGMSSGVLENLPNNYDDLVRTGHRYYDDGEYLIAAEIYRRALDLDGSSTDLRTDYGACLSAVGLPARALEEFRVVITADPMHAIAHFNMGLVHYNSGSVDSARFYWQRYLEIDPSGKASEAARSYLKETAS